MSVLLIILGLVLFVGLVVVHEFGHFIVAKRNGVEAEEFGIGFPPRAKVLAKKNGTEYTLNWLPLGGFVKMKGEHDADTAPGTYGAASLWAKTKILLAGVGMNLVTAFVLLTLLAVVGMPRLLDNQFTVASDTKVTKQEVLVGYVEPGSPADAAGIKARDTIAAIGLPDQSKVFITSQDQLPEVTKEFAGKQVEIIVRHSADDAEQKLITLRSQQEVSASKNTDEPKGYLGVSPTEYVLQRSTWSAPLVALGLIKQFTVVTFQGLGNAIGGLFTGHASQAAAQVSGPVGIFVLIKNGSFLGYQFILLILAVISLTLALINLLPFPALDGGRLFVTLVFRASKKKLTPKLEEVIHGTGFALLMLLFVVITFVDIKRIF